MLKQKLDQKSIEGYKLFLFTKKEEIIKIKKTWKEWQWHPSGDIDIYINAVDNRKSVILDKCLEFEKFHESNPDKEN